jgi:hypothetical protein
MANSSESPDLGEPMSFHLWDRLVTGLKLEVLSHNLSSLKEPPLHGRIHEDNHMDVFDQHVRPHLASRNRELYNLARDAYYRNNVFEIWILTKDDDYEQAVYYTTTQKFKRPLPHIANQIRHLRVRVCTHYFRDIRLEELVMDPFEPCPWLFQAARPLDLAKLDPYRPWLATPRDISWQTDFRNLHTLYFLVRLIDWDEFEYDDERECCIGPGEITNCPTVFRGDQDLASGEGGGD